MASTYHYDPLPPPPTFSSPTDPTHSHPSPSLQVRKSQKPIWPNLLLQHWTGEHVSGHPGLTPVHPVSSYYSHPAFLPHARDIREAQAGMQVGYQVGTKWLRRVTAVLVQIAEKDSFSLFPLIGWFSAINRPLFTTWCQSLESGRSPIAAGGAKAKSPLRGWDLESTDTRVIIIMQTRLASFPHSCQRNSIHMENEFAILTWVQWQENVSITCNVDRY